MIEEIIESLFKRISSGDVTTIGPRDILISILSDPVFVKRLVIAEKENFIAYFAIERAMGKWIRSIERVPDSHISGQAKYLIELRDLLFSELGKWDNNHRN